MTASRRADISSSVVKMPRLTGTVPPGKKSSIISAADTEKKSSKKRALTRKNH